MAMTDTYHSLLIDYARGALDEAHSLLVATHIALSPNARRIVREYEAVGGGMLTECCEPVAMDCDALKSVLDRLDTLTEECREKMQECACKEAEILPDCLRSYVPAEAERLPWKKAKTGLQAISVETTCRHSVAELMQFKGGTALPISGEYMISVTLVLDGSVHDGGTIYSRGDVIIAQDGEAHSPKAAKGEGCTALIVIPCPPEHKGDPAGNIASRILHFIGR